MINEEWEVNMILTKQLSWQNPQVEVGAQSSELILSLVGLASAYTIESELEPNQQKDVTERNPQKNIWSTWFSVNHFSFFFC